MDSESLLTHLDALTAALDDGVDLGAVLAVLVDDLTIYAPSFLGLQLSLPVPDGGSVTLSTIDGDTAGAVRASLLLPLGEMGLAVTGGTVVFYAGAAGVFTHLAATARREYGVDENLLVDGHLDPGDAPPGVPGLFELGAVNQAVGVLIHHGHSPAEARELIARRAATTGESPAEAAHAMSAAPPPLPDEAIRPLDP